MECTTRARMVHSASRFSLQVASALLRVGSPGFSGGSRYQIGWLVQWMCRAVDEPSTAAAVDPDTMRKARELVESVGTDNQREIARLYGRLESYAKVAEATTALGEQEDAARMFAQGQASLKALCSSEQTFKAMY